MFSLPEICASQVVSLISSNNFSLFYKQFVPLMLLRVNKGSPSVLSNHQKRARKHEDRNKDRRQSSAGRADLFRMGGRGGGMDHLASLNMVPGLVKQAFHLPPVLNLGPQRTGAGRGTAVTHLHGGS